MRIDHVAPRSEKKALRSERVGGIVVTVERADGTLLHFDGDEESQKRLDRYSRRMRANGRTEGPWTMADNSEEVVTVDEMEKALDLAMAKQGDLWFL
jgi:hypothetical protein